MKEEEGETRVGKDGSTLDLPACLFFGALGTNIRRKLNQIKLPCFGVDIVLGVLSVLSVLSVLTIAACFTREPLHDPGMGRENGEAMV